MFIVNDPGAWKDFVKRKDNKGLSINEMTQKYMFEANRFNEVLQEAFQQSQVVNSPVSSGGSSQPAVNTSPLPSNCIAFVNNTTDGIGSYIDFTTSGPTNFTVDWGDGTIIDDFADGYFELSHDYADSDQSYNCTICFEDASLVIDLNFVGDDD
jgi:hypothetical protein